MHNPPTKDILRWRRWDAREVNKENELRKTSSRKLQLRKWIVYGKDEGVLAAKMALEEECLERNPVYFIAPPPPMMTGTN